MRCRAFVLVGFLVTAGAAAETPQWSVQATSATHVERYGNGGGAGVYPFDGSHAFADLQLQVHRAATPYNRLYGHVLALLNDSDYRSSDDGLVLENAAFGWELGTTRLPLRIQAGDFLGFYSLRSLQRPLKGVQLELQPKTTVAQSLQVTAGAAGTTYNDFTFDDDRYLGLSYTVAPYRRTRLGINVVHNHRRGNAVVPAGTQQLAGVTLQQRWQRGAHALHLDGEAAYLDGDVARGGVPVDGRDAGYFAQLAGRGPRYDFRLRFEDYGEHFQPNGGVVTSDRRSAELHAGWHFAAGLALRGRLQQYEDSRRSANGVETRTAGLQLATPWLGATAVDAWHTTRRSDDRATDVTTTTLRGDIATLLGRDWSGRAGAFAQRSDDAALGRRRDVHQLELGVDRRLAFYGLTGSAGAGLVGRLRRGGGADLAELGPTLRAALTRPPHELRFNYAYLGQRARDAAAGDNDHHTFGAQYSLFNARHRLTLQVDWQRRDPEPGVRATGNRVAVSYGLALARTARPSAAPVRPPAGAAGLLPVAPGMARDVAHARVTDAGATGSARQQDAWIYTLRVLEDVTQRQQLVVRDDGARVTQAALLIELDDAANLATVYAAVREALVAQHGAPALVLEQGEFTSNPSADIARRALVRLLEWDVPGGRLRFGIPARLDGRILLEVQVASVFPPPRDTRWSIADRG